MCLDLPLNNNQRTKVACWCCMFLITLEFLLMCWKSWRLRPSKTIIRSIIYPLRDDHSKSLVQNTLPCVCHELLLCWSLPFYSSLPSENFLLLRSHSAIRHLASSLVLYVAIFRSFLAPSPSFIRFHSVIIKIEWIFLQEVYCAWHTGNSALPTVTVRAKRQMTNRGFEAKV